MEKTVKMTYGEQLKHPKWQEKRLRILDRAGFKCERCSNADRQLHAHHKHYLKGHKPWEHEDDLLECLCDRCHAVAHAEQEELECMVALQPTAMLPVLTDAVAAAIETGAAAPVPPRLRGALAGLSKALAGSDVTALVDAQNRLQDLIDDARDYQRSAGITGPVQA